MHHRLRQCLLSSTVLLGALIGALTGTLTPHLASQHSVQAASAQAASAQTARPPSASTPAHTTLAQTPATATPGTAIPGTTDITPSPCPVPTTYTAPAPVRRTVTLEDWKASFQIPNNYRALRSGQVIQVLSPESFVHFQCRRAHRLTDDDIPTGITLSFVEGATTEAAVRRQVTAAAGAYLGETQIDSGTTFVHTSHVFWYALHLSRPTPDQQNTVVFSAVLSEAGEIFYEETFDIIRGTFTFSDR
ncbi:MAG: hypothetical protein AAFP03_04460 [Cyanobacteria bacterium J06598_3]